MIVRPNVGQRPGAWTANHLSKTENTVRPPTKAAIVSRCCFSEAAEDGLEVAGSLRLPFHMVPAGDAWRGCPASALPGATHAPPAEPPELGPGDECHLNCSPSFTG